MAVLVITPPENLVSLDDALAHLRDPYGEESLIDGYIAAASAWIDGPAGWLGRSIGTQTLELRTNAFASCDRLPYGPVQLIASVKYVDAQGVEQTLAPSQYELVGGGLSLKAGASWPSHRGDAEGVRIRYVAGEQAVPAQVRQAVLLLVGQWFSNRMSVVVGTIVNQIPFGVEALLQPLRKYA